MEINTKQYIAVTIGPIFDTMSLVSTPAALWASSYMFSNITATICNLLIDSGIKEEEIITPYFSQTDTELLGRRDGVGLFHDHIIFVAEGYDIAAFKAIREKALALVSDIYGVDFDYMKQYVQIAAVKYRAENPILGCEYMLNSRELEKPFVAKDPDQPLLKKLFAGEGSANEWIKKIARRLGVLEKWQLLSGKNIKDLNMIVNPQPDKTPTKKKHRYYAIVRSDGDNMSKIISSLCGDGQFRSFSETCLNYCAQIADEVSRFDGVTIYAGGDDLLAILPCENRYGETPFEFIKRANKIFKNNFDQYNKPTSLSFGITMCYYKFPLYEALEDSASLLFGVAKDASRKNCTVIRLQKHSGQSEGLVIPNAALDELLSLKNVIVKPDILAKRDEEIAVGAHDAEPATAVSDAQIEESERAIVSALHKLAFFEHLLKAADDDRDAVITLFKNMFDSGEQKTTFLHETLPDFYHKLKTLGIHAMTNKGVDPNLVTTIAYVLRMLKFFNEKAGDRE